MASMYPPATGGAQIHMHEMAKLLQKAGHTVQVATMASRQRTDWLRMSTVCTDSERNYSFEGVPVYQLGFDLGTTLRILPWAVTYYGSMSPAVRHISAFMEQKLLSKITPGSLVHATRIGREFLSRAACNVARKWNVPFVITANHHPRWNGPLYREYTRLYREADAVIALSNHEQEVLAKLTGRPERSIHVTGVGPVLSESYSVELFRENYGIHHPYVLFLGQQFVYKGVLAIAEATKKVHRVFPEVRFVFAGPHTAASRKYFGKVADPRIVNLGTVDLPTKTAALAGCELLCLPSMQESFGGVFVEAWSFRKPVIGGRIAPIAELISEGKDGLLTAQQPEEIARLICDLLREARTRRAFGDAGWEKVQQKYTWSRLSEQLQSIYSSLIAGTAPKV
jgi:glycosyltransferase involved in cell wall biosynthesis